MKKYSVNVPNQSFQMMGRVVRAESKFTPAGAAVSNVTIAVSRKYLVESEWKEQTAFFRCAAWNKLSERIQGMNLQKGDVVMVSFSPADLEARGYTDSNGAVKGSLEVRIDGISRVAFGAVGDTDEHEAAPEATISEDEEIPFPA